MVDRVSNSYCSLCSFLAGSESVSQNASSCSPSPSVSLPTVQVAGSNAPEQFPFGFEQFPCTQFEAVQLGVLQLGQASLGLHRPSLSLSVPRGQADAVPHVSVLAAEPRRTNHRRSAVTDRRLRRVPSRARACRRISRTRRSQRCGDDSAMRASLPRARTAPYARGQMRTRLAGS